MSASDPIVAAIEAHRRACAETRGAYELQSAVEDELGAAVTAPEGEPENDPRWIAANDAAATAPTTIGGAAGLLTYYVDVTAAQAEEVFPDLDVMGGRLDSMSIDEPTRDFGYLMIRKVAAALNSMAARE